MRTLCEASGVYEVGTQGVEREWFCYEPGFVVVDGETFCEGHAEQVQDGDSLSPLQERCGVVDEFTKGVCKRDRGHGGSHEVRFE